ncbi:MAG: glutamate--tRNA ligase [Clostridiales Family XIII bacterium]|jgi:glutamyl-tRNA synthetase|nr:glutamate--tRNA ligase [Clostridiales Family XIII bacterium]
MNTERENLAALLFGDAGGDTETDCGDIEARYPARDLPAGAFVTRLGPSPTGFVHLGNLFMATVNGRLARQSGGVFYLRIEDTDQKREVEGAVPTLIESLARFGVGFDEGVLPASDGSDAPAAPAAPGTSDASGGAAAICERGAYGPYFQSRRRDIYRAFARRLVLEGKAYPCFLTEEEIEDIRAAQEQAKELPGIYGRFAKWRDAGYEEVAARIGAGESWVLRLNADAAPSEDTVTVTDAIRGEITFPRNILDVVILKQDGLPTYHFAHVVDDHLMRTTHVVRGEEWLPSLPIHLMLTDALGWTPPTYCHTALLMKIDETTGAKRKLSKRKDPELALSYYRAEGYHPKAIEEYLLTVINSDYEEWRLANPTADNVDFAVTTGKMGTSGILFDLRKLEDVSKDTLLRIPAEELADFLIDWAARERTDALPVLRAGRATLVRALDVGRTGAKPRKDLAYAKQILTFVGYFFDEFFAITDPLPETVSQSDAAAIRRDYLLTYDHGDDREVWFEKIRAIAERHGYAPRPKDYKQDPVRWKGHVGDVSCVIRLALVGRRDSPDVWEIQQILGEERVRARLAL